MRKLLLMGVLTCALFLNGCAFIDEYFLPVPQDTVQEIFEAGNDAMREKDYDQAAVYFNRIKEEHPFSPYTLRAELALADAHFLDEEYWMAVEAYRDFETLHPRNEAIPYVLYQLGVSLRKTYTSIDRSATEVKEAIEYFTRLHQEYPDTEYGRKAPEQIAECRRALAQREIYIGNVFWGMENYQAAYTRFQHVVQTYPDATEEAEYARTKGEAAYLKFRQTDAQVMREKQEGSWKDWFSWL